MICPLFQMTTSIFGKAFTSLFLATRLVIAFSYILRVCKCLLRIRIPVTDSQHFSVSLLWEITRRPIWVSQIALQMVWMPLSVNLLLPKSRLSTSVRACWRISWQSWRLWLSVRPEQREKRVRFKIYQKLKNNLVLPFPDKSISPISA